MRIFGIPNEEERTAEGKKREEFSKENKYEYLNYCYCIDCMNYKFDVLAPETRGVCKCMEKVGAYPVVMPTAVCNKYLSCTGLDINNNPVGEDQWPEWVHLKNRWGKKKEFVMLESDLRTKAIKDHIAVTLVRLFDIDPKKVCEVIQESCIDREPVITR